MSVRRPHTAERVPVYLELGGKRTFAGALDWPGWCRAGKDADAALAALAASAARYAPIAAAAGEGLPSAPTFTVVERVRGNATTDFGAPGTVPEADQAALTPTASRRLAALVQAAWAAFDRTVAAAPPTLRKGPRGGGRDRDQIRAHVLDAERAYASRVGVPWPPFDPLDATALGAFHAALRDALAAGTAGTRWPPRYAARRIAWHVLDHCWEIEDRSEVAP